MEYPDWVDIVWKGVSNLHTHSVFDYLDVRNWMSSQGYPFREDLPNRLTSAIEEALFSLELSGLIRRRHRDLGSPPYTLTEKGSAILHTSLPVHFENEFRSRLTIDIVHLTTDHLSFLNALAAMAQVIHKDGKYVVLKWPLAEEVFRAVGSISRQETNETHSVGEEAIVRTLVTSRFVYTSGLDRDQYSRNPCVPTFEGFIVSRIFEREETA